jgi:hypothetical protein
VAMAAQVATVAPLQEMAVTGALEATAALA